MTYEVVDFRKPVHVPEDIGNMLSLWQASSREGIELRLNRYFANPIKMSVEPPKIVTGTELREMDRESYLYQIDIVDAGPTLLVIAKNVALALIGEMLGDAVEELPEVRPITDIEKTCLDFIMDEFSQGLRDNQKLKPTRTLRFEGQVELGSLHKQFPENTNSTDVGFNVRFTSGEFPLRWILPPDVTLDVIASQATDDSSSEEARQKLEQAARHIQTELRVSLGSASLKISRLASLEPGDVIVLDQQIDDPLNASLDGINVFQGWPGRVGQQQAFQVEQVVGQTDTVGATDGESAS